MKKLKNKVILILLISSIIRVVGFYLLSISPSTLSLINLLLGILLPAVTFLQMRRLSKNQLLPFITALVISTNPINVFFSLGAWTNHVLLVILLSLSCALPQRFFKYYVLISIFVYYLSAILFSTNAISLQRFINYESLTTFLNYFSSRFLIFEGDWAHKEFSVPYIGAFLLPSVLFFYFGVLVKQNKILLMSLLLIPLISTLIDNQPNAYLALPISLPISIYSALGILKFISIGNYKKVSILLLLLFYTISLVFTYETYFLHRPKIFPEYSINTSYLHCYV